MPNSNKPLVSIITPIHNAEQYLAQTVSSVLNQTFTDFEHILVDDCSTDSSLAIARQLCASDQRLKLIELEENLGASRARNAALDIAKGRYIAFLDADDIWLPAKLAIQLEVFKKHQPQALFSSYLRIDNTGRELSPKNVIHLKNYEYRDLLRSNPIGCLTVIIDRNSIGDFRFPIIKARNDYALWLALSKRGVIFCGMEEILAKYRVSSTSLSGNKLTAARYQWKLYRQLEKLSRPLSVWLFMRYLVNALVFRAKESYSRGKQKRMRT